MAFDKVIDTILGEAGGEGQQGMNAVAWVILNRARALGISPEEVVSQPGQFAGLTNPGSAVKPLLEDQQARADALRLFQLAQQGAAPDPTNGAQFFRSSGQGYREADATNKTQIGNQMFYSLPNQPGPQQQNQGSGGGMNFGQYGEGIQPELTSILEQAQQNLDFPIQLTSGYRSPEQNKRVGGAPNSVHMQGGAADISLAGLNDTQRSQLVQALADAGGKRAIAYSGNTGLHIDTKGGYDPQPGNNMYGMFDRTARNMDQAPQWFKDGLAGTVARPDFQNTALAAVNQVAGGNQAPSQPDASVPGTGLPGIAQAYSQSPAPASPAPPIPAPYPFETRINQLQQQIGDIQGPPNNAIPQSAAQMVRDNSTPPLGRLPLLPQVAPAQVAPAQSNPFRQPVDENGNPLNLPIPGSYGPQAALVAPVTDRNQLAAESGFNVPQQVSGQAHPAPIPMPPLSRAGAPIPGPPLVRPQASPPIPMPPLNRPPAAPIPMPTINRAPFAPVPMAPINRTGPAPIPMVPISRPLTAPVPMPPISRTATAAPIPMPPISRAGPAPIPMPPLDRNPLTGINAGFSMLPGDLGVRAPDPFQTQTAIAPIAPVPPQTIPPSNPSPVPPPGGGLFSGFGDALSGYVSDAAYGIKTGVQNAAQDAINNMSIGTKLNIALNSIFGGIGGNPAQPGRPVQYVNGARQPRGSVLGGGNSLTPSQLYQQANADARARALALSQSIRGV